MRFANSLDGGSLNNSFINGKKIWPKPMYEGEAEKNGSKID